MSILSSYDEFKQSLVNQTNIFMKPDKDRLHWNKPNMEALIEFERIKFSLWAVSHLW